MSNEKITAVCFQDINYEDKVELLLNDNYEIKEENGKFYAIKKKPEYPKTYAECVEILNTYSSIYSKKGYKNEIITKLQKLIIYRDAYWKLAGDELKLGRPWEPNLQDKNNTKYVITNVGGNIAFERYGEYNAILSFPTEQMRNAFYQNFKDLIEAVKELL